MHSKYEWPKRRRLSCSILTGTNDFKEAVDAEVRARKIPMSDAQKKSWSLAEKRKKIRQHEFNRKCEEQDGYGKTNVVKDITFIMPQSEELKNSFEKQQKILDKEAGILVLEENEE